jgi:glucosamine-6-phosphate deaminase
MSHANGASRRSGERESVQGSPRGEAPRLELIRMSPTSHAASEASRAGRSPHVSIFPDERAVAQALACRVAGALRANPRLVLGLPTGRTPLLLYEELAALHARGEADFSQASTFNLDEFLGIPPAHPGSYRTFMERHLFDRLNIDPRRIHFLDGSAPDANEECDRYEEAIAEAGGLDLQILGIGTNGHIGFNEPAAGLKACTHRVRLKPETRQSNAMLFGGDPSAVPAEALSMGMGTILRARALVLLATGARKATCVGGGGHGPPPPPGPVTTELPASFLQLHGDVDVMLDEDAGAKLTAES